ncbi:MAG: ATP-binding cassette domain-containing protein, partial [Planctomycetota bacterium]|nr:ATP-binding cassette domain-containing protein [Planctomycetota bacterium]
GLAPEQVRTRVQEALAAVGLKGCEDRVPYHLSVGEKRRAAMATVLAMRPQILVLDEPSADLDPRGRRRLIDLLGGLEATLLVITHDLDLAVETCERTVVVDAGRVVADGPTAEVLADAALAAAHGLEVPYRLTGQGGTAAEAAEQPPEPPP